jgi:hypothetical protein
VVKRRPNASDRDLADAFRRLPSGNYTLRITVDGENLAFMNLAPLKSEGGFVYDDTDRRLELSPNA